MRVANSTKVAVFARFLFVSLAAATGLEPTLGFAQVNTVITDGRRPFSEGRLLGYEVLAGGRTICRNPVAYGRYIRCAGRASRRVWVETNGVLGAYIVVGPSGQRLCSDPMVSNRFRGPKSYILCP